MCVETRTTGRETTQQLKRRQAAVPNKSARVVSEKRRNATKLAQTTLYLKRFSVEARLVNNAACGGYDGHFEAEVSVTADKLDGNGFVVHNEEFTQSIRRQFASGNIKASCEELAQGIVNVAGLEIDDRLVKVVARVYNLTGYAEVFWRRGMELPAFPRFATEREIEETRGRAPSRC